MKNLKLNIVIFAVTGAAILTTGIIFKQELLLMLPYLISLCVMMLQSYVNRYSYLIGGINSLIYGVGFVILGWYGQAFCAFIISAPLQIVTFINWTKHRYGKNQVVFRKMSAKARTCTAFVFLAVWTAAFFILNLVGSKNILLDNTITLIGILGTILVALRYIEYAYLSIAQSLPTLVLNVQSAMADIKNITLVISAVFNLYCVIYAFINIKRLYDTQQTDA